MLNLDLSRRVGELLTSLAALASAMGCAMCFPAIASLGAALGLGFLSQWEWELLDTVMPTLAVVVLVLQLLGWFAHHRWLRTLLGITGPVILLLSLYPWFQYAWSSHATYTGLAWMVLFSLWDMFSPAQPRCDDQCEPASGSTGTAG